MKGTEAPASWLWHHGHPALVHR